MLCVSQVQRIRQAAGASCFYLCLLQRLRCFVTGCEAICSGMAQLAKPSAADEVLSDECDAGKGEQRGVPDEI